MTHPDNVCFLLVVEVIRITLVVKFDGELTLKVGVSLDQPRPDFGIVLWEIVDNCNLQKA